MFVIIIVTCSSPHYVLHIKDASDNTNMSPRSLYDTVPVCCSGFLITKPNMTIQCLKNGEWELESLISKSEG